MPNWRQSTKNIKVELYFEATLWKMILDLMQYFQNKDHQHHKWRQQKSWISYPDCQGAQDKQLTQYLLKPGQNGGCSKNIENSKIGVSRHVDSSTTTQVAKIMVQYGRSSRSSWTKSVWSSLGRTVMGKAIWENPVEIRLGETFQSRMLIRTPWNIFSVFVDDIKLAGKKQNINPMWKVLNKEVDLREPTSFLDHVYLGCTQRQSEISKDIVDNYRTMFESRISAGATEKLPCSENMSTSSWSCDMERSCQEMCGTILWVGKQDDSTTLQSINSMHWRPSFQRRRIEIRGRIVKSMFSNCFEMLVLGTCWTTRYSVVSEQTCAIDHKMNQSVWQTINSFDLLRSSYMWLQKISSCGKHCKTMQIGTVSRLRFCRRSWEIKIYIKWNIVHFRKLLRLFQSVGCVRNKLQFRTVQQNQKSFPWMQDKGWTVDPHLNHGVWTSKENSWKHASEWSRTVLIINLKRERKFMERLMIWTILLVRKLCCECLWRQRSSDQDDQKREEALQWDMFPEPTELLLIGCLIESIWTARSTSNTLTPRTNSQTYWQREISHVMIGIILCVCSTSAISVPSKVLKRCRKEHMKM